MDKKNMITCNLRKFDDGIYKYLHFFRSVEITRVNTKLAITLPWWYVIRNTRVLIIAEEFTDSR